MERCRLRKSLIAYALVTGILAASTLPSVKAYADMSIESEVELFSYVTKETTNGSVDFGRGKASIVIRGNENQSV